MSDYLSSPVLMNGAVGILLLCWAFNLVFTSVMNVRREKENARAPISRIETDITDLRTELDAGPLALLKLRDFTLPGQIFLGENGAKTL